MPSGQGDEVPTARYDRERLAAFGGSARHGLVGIDDHSNCGTRGCALHAAEGAGVGEDARWSAGLSALWEPERCERRSVRRTQGPGGSAPVACHSVFACDGLAGSSDREYSEGRRRRGLGRADKPAQRAGRSYGKRREARPMTRETGGCVCRCRFCAGWRRAAVKLREPAGATMPAGGQAPKPG